jgi:hypothetical protein
MQKAPLWIRITFFLAAIWLLTAVLRVLGFSSDDTRLFRASDARLFMALWGVAMIVLYPARELWHVLQKNKDE